MSKGSRRRPTSTKFGNNFDEIDWSKKDEKGNGGKPAGDKKSEKGGDRK